MKEAVGPLGGEEVATGHSPLVRVLGEAVAVRCSLSSFPCLPIGDPVADHSHVAGYPPHVCVVSAIYSVC